jgi:hypothetical protein
VKKRRESAVSPPRRRRRALENALLLIGCVLVIDALVGDKGLLAMIEARQQFRTLERSLAEVRAQNAERFMRKRRSRETLHRITRPPGAAIDRWRKLPIVKDVAPPSALVHAFPPTVLHW